MSQRRTPAHADDAPTCECCKRHPDTAAYWLSWAEHQDPTPITLGQLERLFRELYDLGGQPETRI